MRKITPFIILLIFFTFVIYLVSNTEEVKLDIEYVSTLDSNDLEIIRVCILNKDDQLVLIDTTKHTNEDIYAYVLKLYDHYRNNLPLEYKSPLKGNFEIENIKKNKDTLYVDLKMQYFEDGLNEFLSALIWSYQDLGINQLEIDINGNKLSVKKDANINPVIASSDIYDNQKQIIFYENGNEILPVTYFHKEDKLNFLMKKVASKYVGISYDIEIIDKFVVIKIDDYENTLSIAAVNLIIRSIKQMGEYDEIVIIINDVDVYNR